MPSHCLDYSSLLASPAIFVNSLDIKLGSTQFAKQSNLFMENVYFILKNSSKLEQLDQCDGMCSSIIVTPIRELPFEPELTADLTLSVQPGA